MNPLSLCLLLSCVLNAWADSRCGPTQEERNHGCCDKCLPGQYLGKMCTESEKTKCEWCMDGHFAELHNMFDRCTKCRSCQQVYAENCTSTTNAKCSCRKGFLCSNKDCSECEESKCPAWEQMEWTEPLDEERSTRNYKCEPMCATHEYFDEKQYVCKPRTQCSALGLNDEFPGNKTHNSICTSPGISLVHGILGVGFVLLSFTLLVFMTHSFIKYLMKNTASNLSKTHTFHDNNPTVFTKASDAQLSQEECGMKLIIMDESINGEDTASRAGDHVWITHLG
ncbi:tumor necrosis factor receptor superfamily member 18 isoform X1 [Nelusetta ayraudi]|uniref:tumor necrosis factor receptor superfamily member 3-like isoform X1 n=1 Tax=Nelusetta ayraudi TaxID=303726 RepID=UPI003F7090A8